MRQANFHKQQGSMLVQAALAIALIALLVGAMAPLLVNMSRYLSHPTVQLQGLWAAQSLLEEVLSLPLKDPVDGQVCAGTAARDAWDDICDADGFVVLGGDVIEDVSGVALSGAQGFRLEVEVRDTQHADWIPIGGVSAWQVHNATDIDLHGDQPLAVFVKVTAKFPDDGSIASISLAAWRSENAF